MGLSLNNKTNPKPKLRPAGTIFLKTYLSYYLCHLFEMNFYKLEFNPLSGNSGGSCSWRPSKGSSAKKGG